MQRIIHPKIITATPYGRRADTWVRPYGDGIASPNIIIHTLGYTDAKININPNVNPKIKINPNPAKF